MKLLSMLLLLPQTVFRLCCFFSWNSHVGTHNLSLARNAFALIQIYKQKCDNSKWKCMFKICKHIFELCMQLHKLYSLWMCAIVHVAIFNVSTTVCSCRYVMCICNMCIDTAIYIAALWRFIFQLKISKLKIRFQIYIKTRKTEIKWNEFIAMCVYVNVFNFHLYLSTLFSLCILF